MLYPLTSRILFPILRRFVKSVEGLENLPKNNPFIIASNHICQIDPLCIIAMLFPKYKKKIHFLSIRGDFGELFDNLIATQWAGCILLDEKNKTQSIKKSLNVLKDGDLVGIFPEGERVPQGNELLKGKTGVIRLALQAQLSILPIGIIAKGEKHRIRKGVMRSDPRDAIKHHIFNGEKINLNIGKSISLAKYYNKPITYQLLRSLTNNLMREISKLCGKKYPY